jgi:hypothetical protein
VVIATAAILGTTMKRPDLRGVIPIVTTSLPQSAASSQPLASPTGAGSAEVLESRRIAAPPSLGALKITTRPPGAQVELDGIVVGVTPLALADLTAGRHTVKVSRVGYRSVSREVEVIRGETVVLDLALSAASPAGPPRRSAPPAPPLPPPPLPPPPR